ncbi:PilN domain-containing protein [Vulcanococcus limneticus]|uniref:PilN domain-containing protein n=1 Tax=Vulcanococcus limneticus TaxID=2170428 RepID=UPI001E5F039E|nr:PilN domain-containing protein [Vulcanococcus limneticus]
MSSTFKLDRLDLLRQRRLELGLPPEAPPLVGARQLVLVGGVIGLAVAASAAGVWLLLQARQVYVEGKIRELGLVPVQLKDLEQRVQAAQAQLTKINTSNEGLAKGLVAVSSGSALLTQLSQITPEQVQLTEATVAGAPSSDQTLTLKGTAADPQAFRRINALQLLLAYSPLFKPDGVVLKKAVREPAAAAADPQATAPSVGPVAFDLTSQFSTLPATAQLRQLRRLGADGMARRLETLQKEGLLR